VRLLTGAGIVPIVLRREGGAIVFGEMTQPVPTWALYDRPDTLLEALGVPGSELPIEVYDNGPRHVLVMAGDERVVAGLRPDLGALAALGPLGVSCFAERVAGAAAGGASPGARRFTTRMFAPGLGVAEDPATGSAAGPLAVHLARHRRIAYGERIEISQGAQIGRPSTLHAVVEGSEERIERVAVGGGAVIVARGEFIVG
jgi:trans-2,3-dihydro-3-hydroxyanthranilate isomerase